MEAKTSYLTFTHICFWCNIICFYICKYVYQIIVLQQQLFSSEMKVYQEFPPSLSFRCSALFVEIYNPGAKDMVDVPPPPLPMIVPPPIPPPAAPIDELIQQSQWNLQQQEQHLHTLRQVENKKEMEEGKLVWKKNIWKYLLFVLWWFD